MTKDEFKQVFTQDLQDKHKISADDLWKEYIIKVQPYLSLLAEFKLETKMKQDEFAYTLQTTPTLFWLMKKYIPEVDEVLKIKRSLMEFEANVRLMRGANLAPDNGKMIEMLMKKWDSEYGKKEQGTKIEDVNVNFRVVNGKENKEE